MGSGISSLKKGGSISLEKRIKYLKETPFYQYLTAETIDEFAKCFPHTLRASPGKNITLDSKKIYVVCEGEVDLSTSYPEHESKMEAKGYLCRKRVGDIVNVCQTRQDVQRRMTVKSHKMKELAEEIMTVGGGNTSILLLCGDMPALDRFSKTHPELSKPIIEIITSQIEDRLLTIPFLREISKSKLGVLAATCRYEAFDSGKTVFEEGSDADKLFLVLSGVAEVVAKTLPRKPSESSLTEQSVALQRSLECSSDRTSLVAKVDTQHVPIAKLKKGDYFGETGLVFHVDRTCGVRTVEKSLFLTVHRTDFENFIKICPEPLGCLQEVIKERMVSKLSSIGIPFLSGIPDDMLSSLASSVVINAVPASTVIFREGDVGDRFYIIVHGRVKVDTADHESNGAGDSSKDADACKEGNSGNDQESEHVLGLLGPGQYFGEMSLVNSDSHFRTATVTSTKKSILLSIGKDSFNSIFGSQPLSSNIHVEFELRLLKTKATLKHILAHSLGLTSFREFLEAEHAGENLDFWLSVKEFASNPDVDKRKAKHIFVTFCAEYADRQVNLPHKMLAEIDTKLKNDEVSPDIFDAARQEIFRLLERDKLVRFRQSEHFKSFLGRLGVL